jgi:hypothetical protein
LIVAHKKTSGQLREREESVLSDVAKRARLSAFRTERTHPYFVLVPPQQQENVDRQRLFCTNLATWEAAAQTWQLGQLLPVPHRVFLS